MLNLTESTPPVVAVNEFNNKLQGVPKRKLVFVSRLTSDTTVEDVRSYIGDYLKLVDSTQLTIHKVLPKTTRLISSFIINIPPDHFNTIVDPKFWPDHCVVHEFVSSRSKPSLNSHSKTINQS